MNIKFRDGCYLYWVEVFKWIGVVIFLIIAGIGSYIYRDCNVFYRAMAIFFGIICAICLSLLTRHGKFVIFFTKEAIVELRRVVWPTFQESAYTTLIIVVVTFVMSMILWGLDGVLVYLVSLSLGL